MNTNNLTDNRINFLLKKYKNVKDGQLFQHNGKTFAFLMKDGIRTVFEEKNKEVIEQFYEPNYHKLPIFSTKFGKCLEQYLRDNCKDLSLLDDTYDIVARPFTGWKRGGTTVNPNGNQTVHFKYSHTIVKGYVQSGKTRYMIASAILYQMFGYSSIIMLRNINIDHVQLEQRIKAFVDGFITFSKSKGLDEADHPYAIEVFDELKPVEVVKEVLQARPPTISICIGNPATMEKLVNGITDTSKYVLFIDECDLVDSQTADIRLPLMNGLKENASMVVGVSATILSTAAEWKVNPRAVRELSKPDNYFGLEKIQFVEVDTGNPNTAVKGDSIEEIFEAVPYLEKYLKNFNKRRFATAMDKEIQAHIDLIRISTTIAPQITLRDYILKTYKDIATVLCVGDGIEMTSKSLGEEPISAGKYKSKVRKEGKTFIHRFSDNVDIGGCLAVLQKIGYPKIQRVLCLAGMKASRSVSFVASMEEGIQRWHINRMFMRLSKDCPYDESMQIAGRVCGTNFFDHSVAQIIYASNADIQTIIKAYHTQEEYLKETSRKYGKNTEIKMYVNSDKEDVVSGVKYIPNEEAVKDGGMLGLLEETEMSDWKFKTPSKTKGGKNNEILKNITTRDSFRVEKVRDDKRLKVDDYKSELPIIKESLDEMPVDAEIEEDEFRRLEKMFAKWSNQDSKIASFMKDLDPNKVYSEVEMKEYAKEKGVELHHMSARYFNDNKRAIGYGLILKKENQTYRLHPCLETIFKTHF